MNRIEKLIASMTLSEKLGQLTMTASSYAVTGPIIAGNSTAAIKSGEIGNLLNLVGSEHVAEMQRLAVEQSRLGVPLLIGFDVIHGHRTAFPVPLGEAGTFDPELWAATAREAAKEAAADGVAMTFAPMLDVSREPRWGRSVEGPGEDQWLASRIAEAKVRGFQGTDLGAAESIAAVAKHFCAYGAVTAGREYASVDISERTLREVYLPPFETAVAAGVAAIMPAFIDLAGVPMTAHVGLLQGWLRGSLGFEGLLISDYNAIAELIHHGIAADLPEAAALALRAGIDIDMMSEAYRRGLPIALERKLVSIEQIDGAVRRVLMLKERLGLFDDPYRRGASVEPAEALKSRRRLAREVALRSVVMLKNLGDALPLSPQVLNVTLLGPLADSSIDMRGPWWGAAPVDGHVTVLEALRQQFSAANLRHVRGVDVDSTELAGMAVALQACEVTDAIVLCVGESAAMSGEAASRAHIDLPGQQRAFTEAVIEQARRVDKPVVVIVFSGRPLTLSWLLELSEQAGRVAVLAAWFPGSEAGNALVDLMFGRVSPSGRTPVTWPRNQGQIPIFFSERPSGRPADPKDHYTSKYLDSVNDPMVPFGFGLTYGRFLYSNLRVTQQPVTESDTVVVRVEVSNAGAHTAEETVFLFTHDAVASVARPKLELRGFAKISLSPGMSGTVTLMLPVAQLRFLGIDLRPVFEPGTVEVLVGPCADRTQLLTAQLELTVPRRVQGRDYR